MKLIRVAAGVQGRQLAALEEEDPPFLANLARCRAELDR